MEIFTPDELTEFFHFLDDERNNPDAAEDLRNAFGIEHNESILVLVMWAASLDEPTMFDRVHSAGRTVH